MLAAQRPPLDDARPDGLQQVGLAIEIKGAGARTEPGRDLDQCLVVYADLRLKGCAIRRIRIAVAVLPRECGAYKGDCGCECCG